MSGSRLLRVSRLDQVSSCRTRVQVAPELQKAYLLQHVAQPITDFLLNKVTPCFGGAVRSSQFFPAWATRWGMQFNVAKCHVMNIGRNNPKNVYRMSRVQLEQTTNERDIGVTSVADPDPVLIFY